MSNTLTYATCIAALLAVLTLTQPGSAARLGKQPPAERIQAVAKMLPDKPVGLGRPISDRQAWQRLAKHPAYAKAVASAAKLIGKPLPEQPDELFLDFSKTGNRTRWQRVAGLRRKRIPDLVLAECIENKGRFLPDLEKVVRAVCAERTWVMPAHDRSLRNFKGTQVDIDLASSAMAWTMATTNYLLGDKLSAEVRAMIRDNVEARALKPFRDMATGKRKENWWMLGTNNWNAVCLAGVTGAALAQVPDRADRALFVIAAQEYVKNFLAGFTKDGYCSEGVGYWNYGFGHYVLLAETIHQATDGGIDLLTQPEVRNPALYGARIEIAGGVYPSYADCSVRAKPDAQLMHFISRQFGLGLKRWESKDMASPSGRLFVAVLYSFPNSASKQPPSTKAADVGGARTWFEDAGVLICRPGDRAACKLAASLKGGNNAEHHNHNDVGSYIIVLGGRALVIDPGGEVYTRRTFSSRRYESNVLNSFGHSVPRIAGKLQRKGRSARGRVMRTDFTDAADTFAIDMTSAYAVKALKRLHRTFVFSRERAGSLTVTDEVVFTSPQTFDTAIVTTSQWQRLGPNALKFHDGKKALRADIDTGGLDFQLVPVEIKEDVRTRRLPVRIGIELKQPVDKATVRVTFTPMAAGK